MSRALVLAGGGLAGIAWELGVLLGIEDVDPGLAARLLDPAVDFVGTSAGSVVASQISGTLSLRHVHESHLTVSPPEVGAVFDAVEFGRILEKTVEGATSPVDALQRVGRFARDAETVEAADRRAIIVDRLPIHSWPERRLLITAVDTDSGELRVIDRHSGVELVDAVGASCAVPGIWPTVEIDGRHYMDGGARSTANADLAAGADTVLILVPSVKPSGSDPAAVSRAELDALGDARVLIVYADAASVAAFGANPLDAAVGPAAARAGVAQGQRIAAEVADFWP